MQFAEILIVSYYKRYLQGGNTPPLRNLFTSPNELRVLDCFEIWPCTFVGYKLYFHKIWAQSDCKQYRSIRGQTETHTNTQTETNTPPHIGGCKKIHMQPVTLQANEVH